ncbi:hypothetical protein NQZ79_g7184 [Umbelopsis isabellina]|nr:hypothetical protein NQZ79_g7184 [Umbelopsis isabellina]
MATANIEIHQLESPGTANSTDSSTSPSTNTTTKTTTPASTEGLQKQKKWFLWWNSEEWWACWIGFVFFGIVCGCVHHNIPQPEFLPWRTNPFGTFATQGNYGLLVMFPAMGFMLWLALTSIQAKNWSRFPLGFTLVFCIALISKMLASNVVIKSASLGDSIWAIIFGAVLRNLFSIRQNYRDRLPPWLKIAQQTELYIAISLVLLCIDMSVLKPLAPRALLVSWIDTPTLFMVVAYFGYKVLKIDMQTAIIMSGATFICGSSAAIALGAAIGAPSKTEMPIAIISVFTIPSIIALPYVAKSLYFTPEVSGAWFGGCVDSTGAVIAAASIYGDKTAINTSAVVKMMQNVLIGPLSVIMTWAWARHELAASKKDAEDLETMLVEEDSESMELEDIEQKQQQKERRQMALMKVKQQQTKPIIVLWNRFPKFVIGFIITAVLFNTVVPNDVDIRNDVNNFCFYISEWFSTLSFVSIGLGLQFNELKRNIRHLGLLCTLYVIAQMIDIVITGLLAWLAFTKV